MRFIAKIHVMDVLDCVVVSGYVYDCEAQRDGDGHVDEFTLTAKGVGLSEPRAWLLNSLYRCLVAEQDPQSGDVLGASRMGRLHTISGTGDTGELPVR